MKIHRLLITLTTLVMLLGSFGISYAKEADLVIYTYDSFVAEWGPGPKVVPKFEKLYGVKVQLVSVGDAGQVLNRAILEKDRPKADIILGTDNNLLSKALEEDILVPYKPKGLYRIPEELIFDTSYRVIPFEPDPDNAGGGRQCSALTKESNLLH